MLSIGSSERPLKIEWRPSALKENFTKGETEGGKGNRTRGEKERSESWRGVGKQRGGRGKGQKGVKRRRERKKEGKGVVWVFRSTRITPLDPPPPTPVLPPPPPPTVSVVLSDTDREWVLPFIVHHDHPVALTMSGLPSQRGHTRRYRPLYEARTCWFIHDTY